MGNGNAVKEIVDFTLTNDEDGVAHAIHKLIEIEKENDHEIPKIVGPFYYYVKVNTRSDEILQPLQVPNHKLILQQTILILKWNVG